MDISGRIQGGVVVLEGGASLPEGMAVTVSYPTTVCTRQSTQHRRIQVPLVRTNCPATVNLTGERIAELLDDEDVSARH